MPRRVLVLGCGPSGLLAAHAAKLFGDFKVVVVSVKRQSQLFGCQYLHEQIPGLDLGAPRFVKYTLAGTPEEYAQKVYGPDESRGIVVSPERFVGVHSAWDIRRAYAQLWEMYKGYVEDHRIASHDILPMIDYYQPDFVFNSIPKPLICADPNHDFRSVKCWAVGDAPEFNQYSTYRAPEDTVLCDGRKDVGFYRVSTVFGYSTTEWPGWRSKPPISGVVDFLKPLSSNCSCWPGIVHIGRMGEWQKGVLSHHAFNKTYEHLANPPKENLNPAANHDNLRALYADPSAD